MRKEEERISEILDGSLRALGVRGRVREEQLRAALAGVVGPALAPLCRALSLERGTLLIATTSGALAHQLQMESPRIIDALNVAVGTTVVRRLRFAPM